MYGPAPSSLSQYHTLTFIQNWRVDIEQASFNELEELPAAMGSLPRLELMRVACNRLAAVPDSFAGLDALAWFSLGGNPACAPAPPARCRVLRITPTFKKTSTFQVSKPTQ